VSDSAPDDPRSTTALIRDVVEQAMHLAQGEFAMARAETGDALRALAIGLVLAALAVVAVLAALGQAAQALAAGLVALGLHPGWAHLGSAAVFLVAAIVMTLVARHLLRPSALVPRDALRNLGRDLRRLAGLFTAGRSS
jgi:Putative Actinobacterial Holin-X, holin superfamily III